MTHKGQRILNELPNPGHYRLGEIVYVRVDERLVAAYIRTVARPPRRARWTFLEHELIEGE